MKVELREVKHEVVCVELTKEQAGWLRSVAGRGIPGGPNGFLFDLYLALGKVVPE